MNEIHHAVVAVVWIDPAKAIPDDSMKTRGGLVRGIRHAPVKVF